MQICEKGPQTLADTISEVEKLQATQQLIATLTPSSTVGVMSHEEDCCIFVPGIGSYCMSLPQCLML